MLTIENDMARLMERPTYTASNTPDPSYPPAAEKVFAILDRFVEKYGSAHLEVFRLPTSSSPELQRFLNSLLITLRRQGVIASYAWQYHPTETAYYLLLFHVVPARCSLSGVVHRLWHSSPPVAQIDNIHIDGSNYSGIKDRLLRSLLVLGASSLSAPTPYYRHSYGASCSV